MPEDVPPSLRLGQAAWGGRFHAAWAGGESSFTGGASAVVVYCGA